MIGPVAISSSLLRERGFEVLDRPAEVSLVSLLGLSEELLHLVFVSTFDAIVDHHAVQRTEAAATAQRLLQVADALAECALLRLCFVEKRLDLLLVSPFEAIMDHDTVKHSLLA